MEKDVTLVGHHMIQMLRIYTSYKIGVALSCRKTRCKNMECINQAYLLIKNIDNSVIKRKCSQLLIELFLYPLKTKLFLFYLYNAFHFFICKVQ